MFNNFSKFYDDFRFLVLSHTDSLRSHARVVKFQVTLDRQTDIRKAIAIQ